MDKDITEEEVWATIKELPADRASGPDEFTTSRVSLQLNRTSWQPSSCYKHHHPVSQNIFLGFVSCTGRLLIVAFCKF
jgi:hypothetical protein